MKWAFANRLAPAGGVRAKMPISPSRVAAQSLRVLPRKHMSRALGQAARLSAPDFVLRPLMDLYCKRYGVDMSEAEIPQGGFRSFDAFFTRRLRPGVRPLDGDAGSVISPADGLLEDSGVIQPGHILQVKGRPYDVAELLGDEGEARQFEGGHFALVYLSPREYHRVHAPVTGAVRRVRHVPGTLFPVNPVVVQHVPQVFARNERLVVHQDDPVHGRVVTMMVGAIGVGHISLSFDADIRTNNGRAGGFKVYDGDEVTLQRGDELGTFHLGSTVIVLTRPEARLSPAAPPGTKVRMGEAIARKKPA